MLIGRLKRRLGGSLRRPHQPCLGSSLVACRAEIGLVGWGLGLDEAVFGRRDNQTPSKAATPPVHHQLTLGARKGGQRWERGWGLAELRAREQESVGETGGFYIPAILRLPTSPCFLPSFHRLLANAGSAHAGYGWE